MPETDYNPREVYEMIHKADPLYSGDHRSHGKGLEPLVVGASLLDVGCGRCLFVQAFHKLRTKAVDISQVVVDELAALGIDIQRAEIQSLPFDDNTYDTVCAFDVLEHIPPDELRQAISELKRVAARRVLLTIGKRPHVYSGIQLHLTLKPFKEWVELLADDNWDILYQGEQWSSVSYMFALEARK